VETAIALGVVGVALGGMAIMQGDSQLQTKDAATASLLLQYQSAAVAYWNANSQAINTAIVNNGNNPVRVGLASGEPSDGGLTNLQTGGYVSAGITNVTPYGAKVLLVFGKDTNGNTDGLIFTNAATGAPIPDLDLGRISMKIGATGGAVYNNAPKDVAGYVQGTGGGWALPETTFTPVTGQMVGPTTGSVGTLVGFFGASGNLTAYLYRNNIGVPAANTMNTDINMAGAAGSVGIDKASNIDTQSLTNTLGGANQAIAVGSPTTSTGLVVNAGTTGVTVNGATGINACGDNKTNCGVKIGSAGSIVQSTNPGWIQIQGGTGGQGLYVSNGNGSQGNLTVSGATSLWGATSAVGTLTTSNGITMANNVGLTGNGTAGITLNGGNVALGNGGNVTLSGVNSSGTQGQISFPAVGMGLQAYNAGSFGSYVNVTDSGSGQGGNLYVTGSSANGTGVVYAQNAVQAGGYMNAPVYYDTNSPSHAYYMQPSASSVFNSVTTGYLNVNTQFFQPGVAFFGNGVAQFIGSFVNSGGYNVSVSTLNGIYSGGGLYTGGNGYFGGNLIVGTNTTGSGGAWVDMQNGWYGAGKGIIMSGQGSFGAAPGASCLTSSPGVASFTNMTGAVTWTTANGLMVCQGGIWQVAKTCGSASTC
jgi:filamentous hemagglutinin